MVSTFRQGISAYGLAILACTVPGLLGNVLGRAVGWSTIAQDAMFGIGMVAFLIIWVLALQYGTPLVTRVVWRMWGIAGVGIFAGIYCFVEADKMAAGSGGRLPLRILGALLVGLTSLVPIGMFVARARRGSGSPIPSAVTV